MLDQLIKDNSIFILPKGAKSVAFRIIDTDGIYTTSLRWLCEITDICQDDGEIDMSCIGHGFTQKEAFDIASENWNRSI